MQKDNPELQQLRTELDAIHAKMARLFQDRLRINQTIWELKQKQHLPFVDEKREQQIVHSFDQLTADENEKVALQNFFKSMLFESKNFVGKKLK